MGLVQNNYYSSNTGIVLPKAYAILKDLVVRDNQVRAVFTIQSSRENTKAFKPIDTVEINFEWDRKSDLAKMAYEKAKTQIFEFYNGEEKFEKHGKLYGWKNDIV